MAEMQSTHRIPDGWMSSDMLLLKYGRPFYMNDKTFAGKRGQIKGCFMNSFNLVMRNPGLTYVEGKCHIGVLPIDHAWVITKDGRVIDPTLRQREGSRVTPHGYFGIPFTTDYIRKVALRSGYFGILDGMINPHIIDGRDEPSEYLAKEEVAA
jgi:hypothetical protein